jgi:hypothetical protein
MNARVLYDIISFELDSKFHIQIEGSFIQISWDTNVSLLCYVYDYGTKYDISLWDNDENEMMNDENINYLGVKTFLHPNDLIYEILNVQQYYKYGYATSDDELTHELDCMELNSPD